MHPRYIGVVVPPILMLLLVAAFAVFAAPVIGDEEAMSCQGSGQMIRDAMLLEGNMGDIVQALDNREPLTPGQRTRFSSWKEANASLFPTTAATAAASCGSDCSNGCATSVFPDGSAAECLSFWGCEGCCHFVCTNGDVYRPSSGKSPQECMYEHCV